MSITEWDIRTAFKLVQEEILAETLLNPSLTDLSVNYQLGTNTLKLTVTNHAFDTQDPIRST